MKNDNSKSNIYVLWEHDIKNKQNEINFFHVIQIRLNCKAMIVKLRLIYSKQYELILLRTCLFSIIGVGMVTFGKRYIWGLNFGWYTSTTMTKLPLFLSYSEANSYIHATWFRNEYMADMHVVCVMCHFPFFFLCSTVKYIIQNIKSCVWISASLEKGMHKKQHDNCVPLSKTCSNDSQNNNFRCDSVGMQVILKTSEWISSRVRVKGLLKIMCCLLQVRLSTMCSIIDDQFMFFNALNNS